MDIAFLLVILTFAETNIVLSWHCKITSYVVFFRQNQMWRQFFCFFEVYLDGVWIEICLSGLLLFVKQHYRFNREKNSLFLGRFKAIECHLISNQHSIYWEGKEYLSWWRRDFLRRISVLSFRITCNWAQKHWFFYSLPIGWAIGLP